MKTQSELKMGGLNVDFRKSCPHFLGSLIDYYVPATYFPRPVGASSLDALTSIPGRF